MEREMGERVSESDLKDWINRLFVHEIGSA